MTFLCEYHEALIREGYDPETPLADHVLNLDEFGNEYHEALIREGYDPGTPLADHVPDLDEFGDGNEDEPESSKQSRSDTVGSEQNKKRKRSGKFVVKYNSLGVPVGEKRRVPDDTKERLWESVKVYFVVHPPSRKQVLQAIRITLII
ncbi:hypothetical protein CUMW_147510 [Citrus unshiu]|nr:hypothetical protein CUMW_147510 [Citrus unshiu]